MIYYPKTISQMSAFNDIFRYQIDIYLVSKTLSQTVLSLPVHPYLS